ncbi:ZCCHC11 [Branchiostoma lanceolatum]|uniref:ZCCHC11 protein n=1 Tax=Branchiostoma lanceolatum TaxID=7740 RepID=A0A8J9YVW8_BRALA|nr:ZCCHC11 [Branchiostoma lanceolatum]
MASPIEVDDPSIVSARPRARPQINPGAAEKLQQDLKRMVQTEQQPKFNGPTSRDRKQGDRPDSWRGAGGRKSWKKHQHKIARGERLEKEGRLDFTMDGPGSPQYKDCSSEKLRDRSGRDRLQLAGGTHRQVQSNEGNLSITADNTAAPSSGQYTIVQRGRTNQSSGTPGTPDIDGTVQRPLTQQGADQSERRKTKKGQTKNKKKRVTDAGDKQGNKEDGDTARDDIIPESTSPELIKLEKELEWEYIFRLKKRSAAFPSAKYFCRLCQYHCDTPAVCHRHIKESKSHRVRIQGKRANEELRKIPKPTGAQVAALTVLLERVEQEQGLLESDRTGRHQLADRVQTSIQKTLPDCKIQLYGSSLSGFALKTSNVNLDVSVPKEANPSEILAKVEQILAKEESFAEVESNFSAKIPCISFKDRESGLQCILSTGNDAAISTCKLLATYARIDSRVRTLGLAFRYWARMCHLDCQSEGSMPPHAYIIMTVYFLQNHQPPLLPVLHEAIPDSIHHTTVIEQDGKVLIPRVEKNSEPVDVTSYRQTTGQLGALWLELLRYYSVDVELEDVVISIRKSSAITRVEKKWPHRRMAVEDPFSTKRNTAKSLNSPAVFDFLTDRLKQAYMYFGVRKPASGACHQNRGKIGDRKSEKQLDNTKIQTSPAVSRVYSESESEAEKSGQNFNLNYNLDRPVDSDDAGDDGEDEEEEESSNEETVDTIGSYTESMDTSLSDTNSTRPRESASDLDMLVESVVENCLYSTTESCVESTSELEVTTEDEVTDGAAEYKSDESSAKPRSRNNREVTADKTLEGNSNVVSGLGGQNMSASCQKVYVTNSLHLSQSPNSCHADLMTYLTIDEAAAFLVKSAIKSALMSFGSPDEPDQIRGEKKGDSQSRKEDGGDSVPSEIFHFEFTSQVLAGGKRPVVTCSLCKKDGHLKDDCPDELKKELKPLPDLTPPHRDLLDRVCMYVYETSHPPPTEYSYRDMILKDLESFIRQEFSGSHLCLFGSSMNGFGFKGSDLDICMTLEGHETSDDLDCIDIIERLAKLLKKHQDLYNILPITTAKVPIVKFVHRPSKLEGDISLYNILAQYNTRMLNMYAVMDERVRILGYTVKRFAKICEIGDASRGSLSSYAYILMLLYFLQQRKPAVIPVLQELHDGQPKPEKMVDGWNAWFYDDLQSLPKKWPHFGENKEAVGELWIGLLRFYTEEFNFREHVICIRQSTILTRFEKMWTSKCIAIEDPFDLNHNLGAGVSRKMNNFIIGAFIKGRETFGMTMRSDFLHQYTPMPYIVEYLFDAEVLTDGAQPPTDRCCRICGKIGHFMKDCPKRRTGKKEKKREGEPGGDQQRLSQRNDGPSRNNRTPGGRGTPQSAKGYYDRRNMMDHDPRSPPRGPYQPTPNQGQYRGSPHRQGGREDPPPRQMYQTPPQPVPFGRQGGGYYSRQRQNSREQEQYGRSPEGRMPLYARSHESPQFTSSPKTTSQPSHNPRGGTNYFPIPTMQYTNQQLTHHPRSTNQQPTPSPPANQQFVSHTSSPNQQLGASPRSNQQLPMHHLANQVSPQVVQAQNRQLPQPRQNWGEVPQQVVMTTQGLVFLSPSTPHTYSAPFHISSSPPYQPHGAQPPR